MSRKAFVLVALLWTFAAAFGGAPDEALVQGTYEGRWEDGDKGKLEANVIAYGQGTYKVHMTQHLKEERTAKIDLDGKTKGEKVVFQGKAGGIEWEGAYADGVIEGRCGTGGRFELKRVIKKSPTLGAKPPKGAIVIFDGTNFDGLVPRRRGKPQWKRVEGGGVQVHRGGMNSKQHFEGSFKLHIEFRCNFRPTARGQGRGNSGVYLPNRTEIQVLDNFGFRPGRGGCGALYGQKPPDVNASLPPLQWQTYDVEYRVQRDANGKVVGKPRVTVLHNGVKIHDNIELRNAARKGPIFMQDHGNPICYRNIWALPLEEK